MIDQDRRPQGPFSPVVWQRTIALIRSPGGILLIAPADALYHYRHVRQSLARHDDHQAAETAIQVCLGMLRVAMGHSRQGGMRTHSAHQAPHPDATPFTRFWHQLLQEYALGAQGTMEGLLEGCKCLSTPSSDEELSPIPH